LILNKVVLIVLYVFNSYDKFQMHISPKEEISFT